MYAKAVSLFQRALALDAGSIEAQSWLATALASRVLDGLTDTPAADIARAEELAAQAVTAAPRNQQAHFAKGQVLRAQHRPQEAIPEYETVFAFNCNHVNALVAFAWCKLYTGAIEEVIPLLEQAIRSAPVIPQSTLGTTALGWCIWRDRASMRRSPGLKSRVATIQHYRPFTPTSPPLMPSKAKWGVRLRNLPKLEGSTATVGLRALRGWVIGA